MLSKILGTFAFAVIGLLIFSTSFWALHQSPVIGGGIGAVVGGALYWLTGQGKSLNDRAGS